MVRPRSLLTITTCAAALLLAPAAAPAASNLDGFANTFPKAAALCVKADKGRLSKQLRPSAAKVRSACNALRKRYGAAHATLLAATDPLRVQLKGIIAAERAACLEARRTRNRTGCRDAAAAARAQMAPVRAQLAAAQKAAQASYEQARKAFWASIRKLRGGASLKPDAPAGQPELTDVPPDTALDSAP